MPISINGSGTITGVSVGGLPDGTVDTDTLAANAVTEPKLGANEASGLVKAWVRFIGTGTVSIAGSFNVSSITDNGTGNYTANFTTALPDNEYAASISQSQVTAGWYAQGAVSLAAASVRVSTRYNGAQYDPTYVYVIVSR